MISYGFTQKVPEVVAESAFFCKEHWFLLRIASKDWRILELCLSLRLGHPRDVMLPIDSVRMGLARDSPRTTQNGYDAGVELLGIVPI